MSRMIAFSLRKCYLILSLTVMGACIAPAVLAADAEYTFPGLEAAVTVYEDALGIPTIVAQSEADMAFVLGYLQARDRFFQMDMNRKGAAGRAAELFGASALASDIQYRTIGLGRAALASWQALGSESKGILQSYANGVNTWLRNNPLPPEYTALELTSVEPWTPLDTMLIAKGLAAVFSLSLDDIDNTITLGTYQGYGDAIGFDGVALFFEDTHRSAPADDRVSVPGFLGSIGGLGQSDTEAGRKNQKDMLAPIDLTDLRVPEGTIELARSYREKVDLAGGFLENPAVPEEVHRFQPVGRERGTHRQRLPDAGQ